MTKEELLALGLTEEQVTAVVGKVKELVPKKDLDDALVEQKRLEGVVKDRDKQIEKIGKSVKTIEDLEQTITTLQEDNKKKDEDHKAEFAKLKIDTAIEMAISKASGKNAKAIKSLLDLENIKINEDGSITGIDKQIEKLVKGEDSSFLFGGSGETLKGALPSSQGSKGNQGITKEQFDKMGYKERVELFNTNPELHNSLVSGNENK